MGAELRDGLAAVWPELAIVAQVDNGIDALHALETHRPQLIFLDIEMPGMTGLQVAAQASRQCHVVFVTAYDRYALAAFEQGAADFVLKPFTVARLATTVLRLKERLSSLPADLDGLLQTLKRREPTPHAYLRWVKASQAQGVRLITVDEVLFFQSDSKYTLVVTADGESTIRKSIAELTQELDPETFWQIHRSTIVNVHAVAGVHRNRNGTLELKLKRYDRPLSVSVTYAHLFKQM
jgi:DNA-binding LytR/AlgR family response regulator